MGELSSQVDRKLSVFNILYVHRGLEVVYTSARVSF